MPQSKASFGRGYDIDQVFPQEPSTSRLSNLVQNKSSEKSISVINILLVVLVLFLGLTAITQFEK
jgi:hypothetical protein